LAIVPDSDRAVGQDGHEETCQHGHGHHLRYAAGGAPGPRPQSRGGQPPVVHLRGNGRASSQAAQATPRCSCPWRPPTGSRSHRKRRLPSRPDQVWVTRAGSRAADARPACRAPARPCPWTLVHGCRTRPWSRDDEVW